MTGLAGLVLVYHNRPVVQGGESPESRTTGSKVSATTEVPPQPIATIVIVKISETVSCLCDVRHRVTTTFDECMCERKL